jgi:hypothetical protein
MGQTVNQFNIKGLFVIVEIHILFMQRYKAHNLNKQKIKIKQFILVLSIGRGGPTSYAGENTFCR